MAVIVYLLVVFSVESNLQTVKIKIIVFNLWGFFNCDWDHSKGKKEKENSWDSLN